MEQSESPLALKVQTLSDIELAILICLVAEQHCIIETDRDERHSVEEELKLVVTDTNYKSIVLISVDCDKCFRAIMGSSRLQ
jgi:hypothetical protein